MSNFENDSDLFADLETISFAEWLTELNAEAVNIGFADEPMTPKTLTHEFIAAINKLPNLPRVRFHDLRHSHATQLLMEGIHPKIAQERLGHSTITTTLDLYSHVTDTMQNDAASKLDTALRSAIKLHTQNMPKID